MTAITIRLVGAAAVAAGAFLAPADRARSVFALGVTAFPLLTPLSYTYYLAALLPAAIALLAVELERDGYLAVPVVGLLLVHLHAHGLWFVVNLLPELFPPIQLLTPYWPLQPGLWGNLLLFGLAGFRVRESLDLPAPIF